MKSLVGGFEIQKTGYKDHAIVATKVSTRVLAAKTHNLRHMACCYIYINDEQVYVGQTRYFDSRLQSYFRNTTYKDGHLFVLIADENYVPPGHERKPEDSPPEAENFGEHWIQQLEYMFINHFKECCWGTKYKIENKKSETPSAVSPSMDGEFNSAFDAFLTTLATFEFPLDKNTQQQQRTITKLYTQHDTKKKFFSITAHLDPVSKLLQVQKGSIGVNHDNASHHQYKKIHRHLKREGYCAGADDKLTVEKPWIAMKIQEIVGAMSNGAGPLTWYMLDGDETSIENKNPLTNEELKLMTKR